MEERDNPLAGTRWQLVTFSEQASAIPVGTTPVLEFREDTLVFSAGCNNVAAFYSVQGEKIAIQPSVRLSVNCPGELGEAAMLLEDTFDAALSSFDTFTLRENTLSIRHAGGEMVLQRLSGEQPAITSTTATPLPRPTAVTTDLAPTRATQTPPDPTTVAILTTMEADSLALLTFMTSAPERRAQFGGVYLDHPGDWPDVSGSQTVLQLVATADEADAIRRQLPPLAFPERLRIDLVSCTAARLQTLHEQLLQSPAVGELLRALTLDTRHNVVGLMVKPSAAWVEVNGLIDKSSLPAEIGPLVADDCIEVSQG